MSERQEYTPVGTRVVVSMDVKPKTTKGGVLIPESVADPDAPPSGVVVGVGPKVEQLKVGDRVILQGQTVHLGCIRKRADEFVVVCLEDQVVAVVNPPGGK